jgi:formylglycine-generating enzyme required for sulfatase activity/WD40 repeat protein
LRPTENENPPKPQTTSPKSGSHPPRRRSTAKLVATCGGGALLLMLLGVILIRITGKDGTESVITVPEGTQISVDPGIDGRIEITRVPDGSDPAGTGPGDKTASAPEARDWNGWPREGPSPAIAPFSEQQGRMSQEEWAAWLKVPVEYTNSLGMKFRLIPPGEFQMGGTDRELEEAMSGVNPVDVASAAANKSMQPKHRTVITNAFYLGIHEVRQKDFAAVMGTNPAYFSENGEGRGKVAGIDTSEHPVTGLSWNQAIEFCLRLDERDHLSSRYQQSDRKVKITDGIGYRIPLESHWEYAARAGTETIYWTGDSEDSIVSGGWSSLNAGGCTHPVGQLRANAFGLFDMAGNAWEYCEDLWSEEYFQQFKDRPAIDPQGSLDGTARIVRGGDFVWLPFRLTSAHRGFRTPVDRGFGDGFRVELSLEAVKELIQRTDSNLTQKSDDDRSAANVESAKMTPESPASETSAAESMSVAKSEGMKSDATTASGPSSNSMLSVAGTLAPPELRLKERSVELPSFKSVLRPGQPLGEFAAVSSPGKVENIISWSIEPVMHRSMFRCIDVSSEGLIATGGNDNSVRIWTKDWQLLRVLPGHANALSAVAYSPDGKSLASLSFDPHAMLALWDVSTGQLIAFHNIPNWVGHMKWLPDGRTIARGGTNGAEVINPWSGEQRSGKRYNGLWVDVAVSPDGGHLIYTDEKGVPQVVDVSSLNSIRTIDDIGGGTTDWSRDGKWIVVTNGEKTVILDSRSYQIRTAFSFGGLAKFSPDSTMLAVAIPGKTSLFDTKDWSVIREIPLGASYDFAWSADGRQLHSSNGSVDVTTGLRTPHPILSATTPAVSAVSSDGRRVATIANSRLRIFDGSSGQLKTESTLGSQSVALATAGEKDPPTSHQHRAHSGAVCSDRQRIGEGGSCTKRASGGRLASCMVSRWKKLRQRWRRRNLSHLGCCFRDRTAKADSFRSVVVGAVVRRWNQSCHWFFFQCHLGVGCGFRKTGA